jgi:IS5 family transposase
MLRIHFLQLWWNLSDPAMEAELQERPLCRGFAGLEGAARLPDETTILRLRHLLKKYKLAPQVLATIIAAPSSTKNKAGERDPEKHQAKKGNRWHFDVKAHIGEDAESGLAHTLVGTAASVNDVTQTGALLHGQETVAFGDAGYRGVDKWPEARAPIWHVAMRPGERKALDTTKKWARLLAKAEQLSATVMAKAEHPFHVVKQRFGYAMVRYQGLAKNTARLTMLFALGNLWMVRRPSWTVSRRSTPNGLGFPHHNMLIVCTPSSSVTNGVF